jgi:transposase
MSKYSFEFKKNVVKAYLNGEGGYSFLAKKFGIPSKSKVKLWVDNYNTFGDEGLKRSRKKDFYSSEENSSESE